MSRVIGTNLAAMLVIVVTSLGLLAAPAATGAREASAAGFNGVELMTVDGHHLTGQAAENECSRYLSQGCGGCPKFVAIGADRMPFIARNVQMAWKAGKPVKLSRATSAENAENRKYTCIRFSYQHGGSCDEYPFASSQQGGRGAQEQEVPRREQSCQGGTIIQSYNREGIAYGEQYVVILYHTELIPPGGFTGIDIAKEKGLC